ncbi:CoA-binding domain protein [Hippea maritima DSM 10411]|uniref:CoA-binding domain protein n=2 Tax=Hippea TaxID=84404 RepID=F2LXL3_HIPMA|nr:CoA-binding domain protein [Hippea maritima DSM 10411]
MEIPKPDVCRVDFGQPTKEEERKIKEILKMKTIAVVGISPKETRPSNDVARYMLNHGYDVIPVRPASREILGRKCYRDLESIDRPVDVVDVFRRSEYCPEIAKKAVKIGAKALWLQEGVISEEAKRIAEEAGLLVIMDYCLKKAHQKYSKGL